MRANCSDERLTLKTSALLSFYGGNLSLMNSFKIQFSNVLNNCLACMLANKHPSNSVDYSTKSLIRS